MTPVEVAGAVLEGRNVPLLAGTVTDSKNCMCETCLMFSNDLIDFITCSVWQHNLITSQDRLLST